MGCCGNEITEKNKNIQFYAKKEEKNNAPINPTINPSQVPVTTLGNVLQTNTQNINDNYSQIPMKQTNALHINDKINIIENKKDDIQKILNEKRKIFYCYNEEEYSEMNELLNKSNFTEDSMIYYKAKYEILGSIILLREYITIKTKKEEGKAYSSSFEYSNESVSNFNLISLKYVKFNKANFQTEYSISNIKISFLFNYNLLENDDSIITFEISSELKARINLLVTFIIFKFFYKCNYRINFNYLKELIEFYSLDSGPFGKNTLSIISPNEILFKGKNVQPISYFIFKLKDSYLYLKKNDLAFYCYDESEMVNLEKAVNNIKISCHDICIFSYKDFYTIQSNTCFVKSYITFICINNPEGIYYSTKQFLLEKTNLKFINLKYNNNELDEYQKRQNCVSNEGISLTFNIPPNEYFGTLELDYSFSIRQPKNFSPSILIDSKNLCLGGYFQLFVNIKDDIYYSYYLQTKGNDYERKEKDITWRTFYEAKPKKFFNKLYLMISNSKIVYN